MFRILLVSFLLLISNVYSNDNIRAGVYKAFVDRIYDGDTFYGDSEIWPGIHVKNMGFRLYGVGAPELKEKFGTEAKEYLKSFITEKTEVLIEVIKLDKYSGRVDVKVYIKKDDKFVCLNEILTENNIFKKLDKNGKKLEK